MYIIVTKDLKLVEQAAKNNDYVLKLKEESIPLPNNPHDSKNVDNLISNVLIKELGIKPTLKGFKYLTFLIKYCLDNPGFEEMHIINGLYPICSSEFNVTIEGVGKAIRNSIMIGFKTNGHNKEYINVFGNMKKSPTCSLFIKTVVLYLRQNI